MTMQSGINFYCICFTQAVAYRRVVVIIMMMIAIITIIITIIIIIIIIIIIMTNFPSSRISIGCALHIEFAH